MKNVITIIAVAAVIIGFVFIFIVDIRAHEVLVLNENLFFELSPAEADDILEAYSEENSYLLTNYYLNHRRSFMSSSMPGLTECEALDNIICSGVNCLPAVESCITEINENYSSDSEMLYILQLLIDDAAKINSRNKPYPLDASIAIMIWNEYKASIPNAVNKIISDEEDNIKLLNYGYLAVPYMLEAINMGTDAYDVIEELYCIIMYDRQMLADILSGRREVEPVEINIMFEEVNQWLEKSEDKIRLIRAIVESE